MVDRHEFVICDVFTNRQFSGNQLAVFLDAAGLEGEKMQALAREMHFSETTFIMSHRPGERGWPVRIFTPAREVPFAGHPSLGTGFVIWREFLGRSADRVVLDLAVGSIPVEVIGNGERFVMTQAEPDFGDVIEPGRAAAILGITEDDIDVRFPVQEVSTGLWFLIVPVRKLEPVQQIRICRPEYDRLCSEHRAKAVLAFCPETLEPESDFHVRVFCDYYDVPEDPATGSANGCLCAWLVRHEYSGKPEVRAICEQGFEIMRPSRLYLEGRRRGAGIEVKVGGGVVMTARGTVVELEH